MSRYAGFVSSRVGTEMRGGVSFSSTCHSTHSPQWSVMSTSSSTYDWPRWGTVWGVRQRGCDGTQVFHGVIPKVRWLQMVEEDWINDAGPERFLNRDRFCNCWFTLAEYVLRAWGGGVHATSACGRTL